MKEISPLQNLKTSVSVRVAAHRRVKAARILLRRGGIAFSDDEIYRRLFRLYLRHWHGHGRKSAGLRRYNRQDGGYVIRPLYINEVLYSALWQRAIHSGESVSRILDVAIRLFLPRLVEGFLSQRQRGTLRAYNIPYWERRYQRRRRFPGDFFINYRCRTLENNGRTLRYSQESMIFPKSELTIRQILDAIHTAA